MEVGSLVVWKIDYDESIDMKLECNPDLEVGIILGNRSNLTNKIKVPSSLVFWTGKNVTYGWTPSTSIKKI